MYISGEPYATLLKNEIGRKYVSQSFKRNFYE